MDNRMKNKVYEITYLPEAKIQIDGRGDEPDWQKATVLRDFTFPWKDATPPPTEFRAIVDDESLYFSYRVRDDDIVLVEPFEKKTDAIGEDRIEIVIACDRELKRYYSAEIDPLGRVLDFQASYHREFDFSWQWPGLKTAGRLTDDGYVVEGSIALAALESLGIPSLLSDREIGIGLFRAEFSHAADGQMADGQIADGQTIEDWISWVDPHIPEPDFHVPAAFGTAKIKR